MNKRQKTTGQENSYVWLNWIFEKRIYNTRKKREWISQRKATKRVCERKKKRRKGERERERERERKKASKMIK